MTEHCGYAALIGAPNAGKSTLLNALIGSQLSIVTPKPQTTRGLVRGIACEGNSQIIFVDTPGIFDAKPKFEKAMVSAAWSGANDADMRVLVVDANRGLDEDTKSIAQSLKAHGKRAVLVINKVDKVEKPQLPALALALYELCDFERSFMISATRGDGVKDILHYLAEHMPEAPWLYPEDELTDSSERDIAAEITREQCFLKLHAELPYSLMVETEKWEESFTPLLNPPPQGVRKSSIPSPSTGEGQGGGGKNRVIRINQIIVVERETHKKIVLGAGGAMLKGIGSNARRKIGEALGATVHLFLFVKVQETWKNDPERYRAAGLEYKN